MKQDISNIEVKVDERIIKCYEDDSSSDSMMMAE